MATAAFQNDPISTLRLVQWALAKGNLVAIVATLDQPRFKEESDLANRASAEIFGFMRSMDRLLGVAAPAPNGSVVSGASPPPAACDRPRAAGAINEGGAA